MSVDQRVEDAQPATTSGPVSSGGGAGTAAPSSALDEVLSRPSGLLRLVERLSRGRTLNRRGFFVGAAVAGSALVTDPKAYALQPQSAYATICGPSTTYSGGWSIFCATVNKGLNACPPGSFTAGWWKAADSSWCGGGYRYIVDCNARCTKCTSGCSDHICDSKCWNCSCRAGSTATCDQRRECCNAFRYGQCNTQVKCSGGVHCRVVSCVAPYSWDNCSTTSFRSDATAEHSSPYLPQWGPIEKQYKAMGAQRSYLRASTGPIRSATDGRGRWVDYQGGRIWWTSVTPAVAMTSAVNAFYLANGGPAALGYPKANRNSALIDGGWVHVCENGCMVDSASTAVQVVTGASWTVWVANGRESGALGYPVAPLETLADGAWLQRFQAGGIVDSAATNAVAVHGIRWTRWVAAGRESGRLGFPVAARETLPSWSWIQRFQNGCLVDSPATSTALVHGVVWTAWQQVGREGGRLGYPTGEEGVSGSGVSQRFRGGGIWGRTGEAAYAVFGGALAEWEDEGGAAGRYGYPVQHTVANADGTTTAVFEGGTITA